MMTVVEAAKKILQLSEEGKTYKQITQMIIDKNLYTFNTKDPENIVNHALRRHCEGLNFPTSHPLKHFYIVSGKRGNTIYQLIENKGKNQSNINRSVSKVEKEEDLLPVERMQKYYEQHCNSIKLQLLENIINNVSPFFEELVVELIIKMGYGYGIDAGKVTGKSHDGGIDGIINEDRLGLDKIYIQAKRFKVNNGVGVKELQAFSGAMRDVRKGIFITTSYFTREAKKFVDTQEQKSICLIDGQLLVKLMVDHAIGIKKTGTFSTYEVDSEFFKDN